MDNTMKWYLSKIGIRKKDLPTRLSMIPTRSQEILKCKWMDGTHVEFTEEEFEKAVHDLKMTRDLVIIQGMREGCIFRGGYEDYQLAVCCGKLFRDLFYGDSYFDTAERFYNELRKMPLSTEERNAIRLYYGLEDGTFYTYEAAGKLNGISTSGMRTRLQNALTVLRDNGDVLKGDVKARVKNESARIRQALEELNISALKLSKDMETFLIQKGCDTVAKFLLFDPQKNDAGILTGAIERQQLRIFQKILKE